MNESRRRFLLHSGLVGSAVLSGLTTAVFAQDESRTLIIALGRQTGNLDPVVYKAIWSVQSMIFEPLIRYGAGGVIEPALAEAWEVSEDGLQLRFVLRQGVTFSDGTPWDADSLKWNLDRWIGKDDHSWLLISAAYDRLEILGSHEVVIHLKEPVPSALAELTTVRPVRFMSPKGVAADGTFAEPIGTGPWKVIVNNDARTELARNDSYWGPLPEYEKVDMIVIPNARSRVDALRSGNIDITGGVFVAALSPQDAKTLQSSGAVVESATGTDTLVLGFNPQREILQDPGCARRSASVSTAVRSQSGFCRALRRRP
jgi:nickel transport system substrate-binding protein